MSKFGVCTKFKGLINKHIFEIVGGGKDSLGQEYYSVKDLKTGKIYQHSAEFIEHLQIEIL